MYEKDIGQVRALLVGTPHSLVSLLMSRDQQPLYRDQELRPASEPKKAGGGMVMEEEFHSESLTRRANDVRGVKGGGGGGGDVGEFEEMCAYCSTILGSQASVVEHASVCATQAAACAAPSKALGNHDWRGSEG